MERAYTGFTWYAVSLFAVLAVGALMLLRWGMRRGRRSTPTTPPRRWATIASTAAFAVAITSAVVVVFIEVLIFQDYGIHFYEFDVAGILADAALRRDLGIQPAEVARVTFAAIGLLMGQLLLWAAAARLAAWRNGALPRACGAVMLIGVPGGLAAFHVSEDTIGVARAEFVGALPLGRQLLFRTASGPHVLVDPRLGSGGYPVLVADASAPRLATTPNIVFFVPDGLRADMIREELTPHILDFAARPEVIHSRRHFSTGHVSEAGIFGLLYSLNGHAFNAFIGARVPAYPIELLKRNGYHTYFLSSSRLNPYPTDQLIRTFDEVSYPTDDDEAIEHLTRFVAARRADGKPYFVLAFFYTPHFPFTSAKPHLRRYPSVGSKARTNYMNDVIQTDDYFRQTFELVRRDYEQGRTLLLVTSDHGEELREHGSFGHASPTFWNEKIQVPFALGLPGARPSLEARRPRNTTHVDAWPTIFAHLGVTPAALAETYSDGRSLLSTNASPPPPPFVAGRFFPYADRPSVLVDEERKYWFRVERAGAGGQLCIEITRVTDLLDAPVVLGPGALDVSRIPAFADFQRTFWRFLSPAGPQTAPCSTEPAHS
ncbi:MAG: sulfatase-like hydrolase/transferase [Gemmatimonadaceae bacterium]